MESAKLEKPQQHTDIFINTKFVNTKIASTGYSFSNIKIGKTESSILKLQLLARWSCSYSTYSTFLMANKVVKKLRNNNLFNEQTQIVICHFQKKVPANVVASGLESHHASAEVVVFMFCTCSC